MTHWGRKKEGAEIVNAGFTGICLSRLQGVGLAHSPAARRRASHRRARRSGLRRWRLRDRLGKGCQIGGAARRRRRAARRLRGRARARRHHLLARSRRCGPAADLRFRRLGECLEGRAGLPGAETHPRGRRQRGVRLRRKRALPLAGREARSVETGNPRAARQLRRVRKSLPAGRGAPDAGAARGGRRLALCGPRRDGAGRRPARCERRRISASSSPTARTAGGSAPRTNPAHRATSSSNRRPAGG